MSDSDFSRHNLPWLRGGFDLEGYVGALAAWLFGILLGYIWSPLFWIGFIAAVVILFATRTAQRTSPDGEGLIVAPTDGVIVAIAGAAPPDELRLTGTGWTRVRVSIAPNKTNGIYAPMDGAIDHVIREIGDPAAFYALKPDRPGLSLAYVAFESAERALGVRLATGGLGPRLEVDHEAGDAVRLGRKIGTLRLGGWCDLYLPAGTEILLKPGQTVIGSETVLARFGDATERPVPQKAADPEPVPAEPEPVAEPAVDPAPEMDAEDETKLDALTSDEEPSEPVPENEEDVTEVIEKLRSEARKIEDGD
ncbi:MAG: phosphatidylserine decarboxylase [Pseudomonadota bacterium]